jgi:pyruvate-formate lyase
MPQKFDGITWGIVGVEDFLHKYMTPLTDETSMVEDIQTRTATLLDRVKQDIKNETTEDTKTLRPPLVSTTTLSSSLAQFFLPIC